jgi:hypothetical protein
VRGVFDRMLASDEAIAEAQAARVFEPLFKTKPEGMTDEEWKSYSELNEQATADAIADMQAKSLRDMKWLSGAKSRALKALQKQADTQRKGIEAEVTAEVDQMPLYAAERFLRKGETRSPNGDIIQVAKEGLPGTKFNTERIKEMYPESALDRPDLDKLKGMTGPKGLDPDLIADMFGFRSGDELVRKLIDMEPRESVIEGLTDKRMLEEHGEVATPQALEAAANEAVHNDARARFIATGLKVLAKSPIPARELLRGAREAAEGAIAAKKVRDLNPRQYEAAETKANKEAIKLAAKDPAQAIQAQRQTTVWRRTKTKRIQNVAKLLVRLFFIDSQRLEHGCLKLCFVNPDRTTAQLVAIENDIVSTGAQIRGKLALAQFFFILCQRTGEGMVHRHVALAFCVIS